MRKLLLILPIAVFAACDKSDKDTTYPEISTQGIDACPLGCEEYHRGDVIPFNFLFTDDTELGSYNIEIHNNFDHHTHSTSSIDCDEHEDHDDDEVHDVANAWVYNQDFAIPNDTRSYCARHDIEVPSNAAFGAYHFMIRVTDAAGWQQLHSVEIHVVE